MWTNHPFALSFGLGLGLFTLIVWSLIWKAVALWKAARNNDLGWYVALLILNTAGILEIIYIYGFSKKSSPPSQPPATP